MRSAAESARWPAGNAECRWESAQIWASRRPSSAVHSESVALVRAGGALLAADRGRGPSYSAWRSTAGRSSVRGMVHESGKGSPKTVVGVPLLIMMSLADGAKHGHGLMKDIDAFAGVRLGPGTLYKSISRLESLGLIEALEPDERRRPYRLTAAGAVELAATLDHLASVVGEGRRRMRLIRPGRQSPALGAGAAR